MGRELRMRQLQATALSWSCGRMLRTLSTSNDRDPAASLAHPRAASPSELAQEWIHHLLLVPTAKHHF